MSAMITEARVNAAVREWRRIRASGEAADIHQAMRAALAAALSTAAARREAEWHEDYGDVVWWTWRDGQWLGEAAFIGSPLGSDWPGYHTHWTPHPSFPAAPLPEDTHHGR